MGGAKRIVVSLRIVLAQPCAGGDQGKTNAIGPLLSAMFETLGDPPVRRTSDGRVK